MDKEAMGWILFFLVLATFQSCEKINTLENKVAALERRQRDQQTQRFTERPDETHFNDAADSTNGGQR